MEPDLDSGRAVLSEMGGRLNMDDHYPFANVPLFLVPFSGMDFKHTEMMGGLA